MNKKYIRLAESDLHRIVKESLYKILSEDKECYNQVMSTLNSPTAQKGLKKAWNKERKKNPNADYDSFEYNHALNLQNKKRKEDERYGTVKESRYYNPRTYERDETKEFTHDEIMKLVEILKQNPIEERWKPYDLGFCKVQRVEANNASGTHYLLNPSKTYDPNRPDDSYCDGNNGTIYLQIGRLPNTHWLDDSGYTYMCWK